MVCPEALGLFGVMCDKALEPDVIGYSATISALETSLKH